MKECDFSLEACLDSVNFYVDVLNRNPFEELGRSIMRAEEDCFFNRTMIEAWKVYIRENNLSWDNR